MLKISYTVFLLKCAPQPTIAKITKTLIFGVAYKVAQGHRCWYQRKACQQCSQRQLCAYCNRFRAGGINLDSGNNDFYRGTSF